MKLFKVLFATILITSFFGATKSCSQTEQNFDFYKKQLKGDSSGVIRNENFTFVLEKINTFKYIVIIDNKSVNNNADIPNIFKPIVQEFSSDENSLASSKLEVSFDDLTKSFIELKTSDQFYVALVELVSSDLSPEKIINYKKGYYKKFMDNEPQEDYLAVANIIKYYSDIINEIKIKAPILKGVLMDAAHKERKSDTEQQEAIDTILKYTNKTELSNMPQKIASLYGSINTEKFTVRAFIAKPDADDLTLTVTAKPNPIFNKSSDEIKIEIPFLVRGGLKIDFSTGIFLSNIADRKYVNKPNYVKDSIIGYNFVKEDKKPISYGIAGYMHAYWRFASNLNASLTLGLGIDQNTQVKIMPGISFILGRKERFVINIGGVVGKIKELSNVQDENHVYKVSTEPIYSEPYKTGGFVGISYNFTK